MRGKKGVSVYLGWVLLMAFMVVLSTFVYSWMTTHVESQAERITEQANQGVCDSASIAMTSFCQDENFLIINITNTKSAQISGIKVQLFDLYDNPYETSINFTLKPSARESVKILKHGTLAQADIIPLVIKGDDSFFCDSSKAVLSPIEMC